MNVLIVEDERNLADALVHIVRENRWNVEAVYNGRDGLTYALSGMYDAVVLDVMLPGMDGLAVCREMRAQGVSTPVIMLTARSEVRDKVAGLDAGADDYLTKPFSPDELLARLRALTRRTGDVMVGALTYGDLELYADELTLRCEGREVVLSQRECAVLEVFMRSPRAVFSKQALLTRVWGADGEASANSVEAYVSFLRKKLQFLSSKVAINTIRMLGYRLDYDPE
jgi:DNA-binding response OmpR family regulator